MQQLASSAPLPGRLAGSASRLWRMTVKANRSSAGRGQPPILRASAECHLTGHDPHVCVQASPGGQQHPRRRRQPPPHMLDPYRRVLRRFRRRRPRLVRGPEYPPIVPRCPSLPAPDRFRVHRPALRYHAIHVSPRNLPRSIFECHFAVRDRWCNFSAHRDCRVVPERLQVCPSPQIGRLVGG
jgi:hypothetical protein